MKCEGHGVISINSSRSTPSISLITGRQAWQHSMHELLHAAADVMVEDIGGKPERTIEIPKQEGKAKKVSNLHILHS